jgi:hypothetical protein
VIKGTLPASFYPKCFRSEENYQKFTKEKLTIDLPTQEIINGFSSTDQVKPPPQYKGTVENGLRIASTGEGVSKARVASKPKKQKGENPLQQPEELLIVGVRHESLVNEHLVRVDLYKY